MENTNKTINKLHPGTIITIGKHTTMILIDLQKVIVKKQAAQEIIEN